MIQSNTARPQAATKRSGEGAFPFLRRRLLVKVGRFAAGVKFQGIGRNAMDGNKGTLRQRWAQRAEQAYRRMFEGKSQEELVTLSQRETMAMLIAKELAAFMLEEHVARDAAAKPTDPESACCPKCNQAGMPAVGIGPIHSHISRRQHLGQVAGGFDSTGTVSLAEVERWVDGQLQ